MRGKTVLVLLAAALGLVTGVAAAFVVPELVGERPESAAGSDEPEPVEDPLGLGIPLENLDCEGQAILILNRGATLSALAAPVANHSDLDLKYLRPEESCDTLWIEPKHDTPDYVLYAGPFSTFLEPCQLRLTLPHKRDTVLRVVEGVEAYVKCLCVAPRASFPTLTPGMEQTASSAIYTWQLQSMLSRLDRELAQEDDPNLPARGFTPQDLTSEYDDTTVQRVMELQEDADPPADGIVDDGTWKAVTDLSCGHFDF